MPLLSPSTTKKLKAKLDGFTQDPQGIPGLVYVVINRDGEHILKHASGVRGLGSPDIMSLDTTFWIASCTKLVTTIAAMQLVESGNVSLDSEDDIQHILPELSRLMVLKEDRNGVLGLVEQERKITLRMLLSHTAGFGYSFSNAKLKRWYDPIGINEFDCQDWDIFSQPLVNQPGTVWEYGVGIDWAGRFVERVSGLSLDEYCHLHIFQPLGVSRTTFFPTKEMKENLAFIHRRRLDGSVRLYEHGHLFRKPLMASADTSRETILNSGGAGLFSNPVEYCKILAMLLNQGKDSQTSRRILKTETVQGIFPCLCSVDEMLKTELEMFTNQIPQFPDFARNLQPPCKPDLVNDANETYFQPGDPPQGWGLSFFSLLHPSETGRATGTAWWSGLVNLIWWADLKSGIGGMLATQMLPFNG
ncbi:beta-lactamase transpeptidase [Fusarium pseudoanthophilum]|uniref:Beta-lactamase transpeptidase n=1 Tax=Fusarium pseudoanthophilum TaxID=48495 RepID=A0A8H5UUS1_9HYPO|nr:beta-lactamase transpeptidase [Fusarium pseudoanthophilum]